MKFLKILKNFLFVAFFVLLIAAVYLKPASLGGRNPIELILLAIPFGAFFAVFNLLYKNTTEERIKKLLIIGIIAGLFIFDAILFSLFLI